MQLPRPLLFASMLLFANILWAAPQKCPSDTTDVPASISGTLEYHPGVYAWYGIRPPQPICGQKVVQLGLDDSAAFRQTHRFVGCRVTATGNLFVPDTGYWFTSPGMTDAHIQPDQTCKMSAPLPDYSAVPIPTTVQHYKVIANYDPNTLTFSAQVQDASSGKSLVPWQTYVSDAGNGARDLQRMDCAQGFVASGPKDTRGQPDLQAAVDPDLPSAIDVVIPNDATVQVSFLCTRSPATKKR